MLVKGEVYVVDHDHGIKFLDTSPLIYVDFDGRNLKHPIVHVLGIFYFQACMGISLLYSFFEESYCYS